MNKIKWLAAIFFILSACQTTEKAPPPLPVVKVSAAETMTLAFVGDVILHERLRTREEKTNEGYQTIWSEVQSYLDRADFTYANLEGPVAPNLGGVSGFPKFNFPEKIIPALKNSGFDVVSNANNHALDRGPEGIRKTLENLKKYKLNRTGTISGQTALNANKESWFALTRFQKKYVAWISCTEMTNGLRDKETQVLYCFKDLQKVKEIIEKLKQNKDVIAIILLPHWGEEEKFKIESYRKRWAHIMLNLGASAVVGSHPHVVQKIESFVTEDNRQTFIAYSLGNFVSNQSKIPNKTSMIFYLRFKKGETSDEFILEDAKYLPLWMKRTIEKDGTAKYRLKAIFDLKKVPDEASEIWNEQTGIEHRLNTQEEVETLLSPSLP